MWSLTKGVKSGREDNREVLPWQAVYPHDRLARCLFPVGLAVAVGVTEAFTSKSRFFSVVSSGWPVKYGGRTRLSCWTTLRVRLLSSLLTCPSLRVYLPFCPPLPPTSTRSFAGPGYSSVQHSVRSRRPSSRLSNQDQASPQWDWSSTPAVADGEDEDGVPPELRSSPLPMALKRALRYETFSC